MNVLFVKTCSQLIFMIGFVFLFHVLLIMYKIQRNNINRSMGNCESTQPTLYCFYICDKNDERDKHCD